MSEIDLSNGYVRVANKLLEIIYSSNFNATQLKILLMIMRYTYGFNRKSHSLSISFLSNGIGISRRSIGQELRVLIDSKVLEVCEEHTATESREISINKNYKSWRGYGSRLPQWKESSTVEPEFHTGMEAGFHSGMEGSFHQDKTNIKTNIKTSTYTENFEAFYKIYPNSKGKAQTFKNYQKVIKQHEPGAILEAARRYKKTLSDNTEKEFITTSYNFLGSKAVYMDYLPGIEESQKHKVERKAVKVLTEEDQADLFRQMELDRQTKINARNQRVRGERE